MRCGRAVEPSTRSGRPETAASWPSAAGRSRVGREPRAPRATPPGASGEARFGRAFEPSADPPLGRPDCGAWAPPGAKAPIVGPSWLAARSRGAPLVRGPRVRSVRSSRRLPEATSRAEAPPEAKALAVGSSWCAARSRGALPVRPGVRSVRSSRRSPEATSRAEPASACRTGCWASPGWPSRSHPPSRRAASRGLSSDSKSRAAPCCSLFWFLPGSTPPDEEWMPSGGSSAAL